MQTNADEIQAKIRKAKEILAKRLQAQKSKPLDESSIDTRRGLAIQVHPLLAPAVKNPYTSERHKTRKFTFNVPGKYAELGDTHRLAENLQKLKKEVEAKSRSSGLERELELVSNQSIRNDIPPVIEWWDSKLTTDYGVIDDGLINNLVQHPIPIIIVEKVVKRELMLTKVEQKKLRRRRRSAVNQERQDKIRLGLIPPDEPRITKSNFMRVLGAEAVKERQDKHERSILENRLSDADRRLKKDGKLREDTSDLVFVLIYKIKDLTNKQHLFKINTNAKEYKLSGCCIINENLNMVIVEGGPKGTKAYKKLIGTRMNWDVESDCVLVWEGMVTFKNFSRFSVKHFESGLDIKQFLEKMGCVQYWNAAKTFVNEDY